MRRMPGGLFIVLILFTIMAPGSLAHDAPLDQCGGHWNEGKYEVHDKATNANCLTTLPNGKKCPEGKFYMAGLTGIFEPNGASTKCLRPNGGASIDAALVLVSHPDSCVDDVCTPGSPTEVVVDGVVSETYSRIYNQCLAQYQTLVAGGYDQNSLITCDDLVIELIDSGQELLMEELSGALARSTKQVTQAVSVELNAKPIVLDPPAFIENGRTLVPMRAIFEALGATIAWDGGTQTVTATRGTISVKLTIGSSTAWVNDKEINLDVPPKLVNSRTFVPVRFVAEALGAKVGFHDNSQTVLILDESLGPVGGSSNWTIGPDGSPIKLDGDL